MKKLILILCVLQMNLSAAQNIYLHCGQLIDTEKGVVLTKKTVIVSGEKIKAIKNGFVVPENPKDVLVDLKSKTVMPGLIDMHVHMENEYNPARYMDQFTANEADVAFKSVNYAEITLLAGFTTVRDLGGTGVNIALRNAINNNTIVGPRIFTAGKAIATTGGHADPTNGRNKLLMGDPGPEQGVINSPDEARKAVRQRYKNGADNIKITATGGVLSVAKNGQNPQFTIEEVKAICATAKDYGMIIAAHAHGDEGMQRAVIGGVTTIEHGTKMSTKTMDLMKEYGTYFVPTITAGKAVAENAKIEGFYPEIIIPKALEIGPKIQSTFAKAYKRGVPIAFGTDAGVFPHGLNAKEFGYMVEVGMPEMEAIQSATITNAKVLGLANQLGQIKTDYIADIVATDSNPVDDISAMERVDFVMKAGKIYKK
ncbi:amidohydrolase family protein [Flavobacteriaceae bacterium]|jgi:imidazolonepropionase-like amidohydrolase|uniref:metal-dependent hydrolase family protein n=1 Tax=Formosa sp. Hel3_A1_48 TaxID=1336795 RepID=UPI00084E1844|nr:amidohydrolase family protein [Formosa sp. Hel3_A1_48]MDC0950957.1 amidohydrolase family protein [Flavobacteriaceae bacterium]NCF41694.1 amidohydrolase family protein [Bacteroidota bacterium]